MTILNLNAKPYQQKFFVSQKRFPCLKAGIGTGKTMWGLLKVFDYCQRYPDSLALITRKEYTDLRDSTIKDFKTYFGIEPNSNKEVYFPNKSIAMFRHGSELNVLKNINLSIALMEQGEEFDSEEPFDFIRDRLRRSNAPYRQLCVIANANGHNWIWRRWKAERPNDEYDLTEATTFDNADNLPVDFIEDIKRMEIESPNHYRRMVMNDDDCQDIDDLLINEVMLEKLKGVHNFQFNNIRLIACDPSSGGDECPLKVFDNTEEIEQKILHERDTMKIVGELGVMAGRHKLDTVAIDVIGIGKGVADRAKETGLKVIEIQSAEKADNEEKFVNRRSEMWWYAMEQIRDQKVAYPQDPETRRQLSSVKYKIVNSNGKIALEPKDQVRKRIGCSPDRADTWIYGIWAHLKATKQMNYDFMASNKQPLFKGTRSGWGR